MSDYVVLQEKDAVYLMVRHACGHWERHPWKEVGDEDDAGPWLAAATCRVCQEKKEKVS
jgi:hypothetical protein